MQESTEPSSPGGDDLKARMAKLSQAAGGMPVTNRLPFQASSNPSNSPPADSYQPQQTPQQGSVVQQQVTQPQTATVAQQQQPQQQQPQHQQQASYALTVVEGQTAQSPYLAQQQQQQQQPLQQQQQYQPQQPAVLQQHQQHPMQQAQYMTHGGDMAIQGTLMCKFIYLVSKLIILKFIFVKAFCVEQLYKVE